MSTHWHGSLGSSTPSCAAIPFGNAMLARTRIAIAALLLLAVTVRTRAADDAAPGATDERSAGPLVPERAWLVVIVGHPGDEEYEAQFADIVARVGAVARDRLGLDDKRILIWSRSDGDDPPTAGESQGPATRDALERGLAALREQVDDDSELWVIVLGHAHAHRAKAQLNLPGPDVDAKEFARWFADFPCRRSVFLLTTPLSGRFLEALSAPRRAIIAAAAADEINGTIFPLALADQLESLGRASAEESAGRWTGTLLDVYRAMVSDVSARYEADELIPTEHALLDDNGDGRGSEIDRIQTASTQVRERRAPSGAAGRDGALANSIRLDLAPGGPKVE
jgi:hypothetical protein